MIKAIFISFFLLLTANNSYAGVSEFDRYFKVDMLIPLPDLDMYYKKITDTSGLYDKGYRSRWKIGNRFKKEFSQTIKFYGMSEGRIKADYEDELLELLSWMPKEYYPYIGPMLHEVPGMPEKILNLPGIKETKNQFPEKIADRFVGVEDIEYLSPGLYFLLMPDLWEKKEPAPEERLKPIRAKKPRVNIDMLELLKTPVKQPEKTAERKQGQANVTAKKQSNVTANLRTINPTLTSKLTAKDVEAVIDTLDPIMEWGLKDDMKNYAKLIVGEVILNYWEKDEGTALDQNDLKDIVNPCQRLVLKTRFSGQYEEFAQIVANQGFSPEEWGYTCDKTIKAFRVAEANLPMAHAIEYHRRGYYNQYINQMPPKWQRQMYAMEAALIKMYTVFKEDVAAVSPYKNKIREKIVKMHGLMLTGPIIY